MNVPNGTAREVSAELLRLFDAGVITSLELESLLVEAAAFHEPSELLVGVPSEITARLRARSSQPPLSPDDGVYIQSWNAHPGFDSQSNERDKKQSTYYGSWKLRRFFGMA
jgi:hypothetical protein